MLAERDLDPTRALAVSDSRDRVLQLQTALAAAGLQDWLIAGFYVLAPSPLPRLVDRLFEYPGE